MHRTDNCREGRRERGLRRRRGLSAILVAAALLAATGAQARAPDQAFPVDLRAGRLADALSSLSVRTRINILFSPDVVGARSSRRVVGVISIDRALQQLLAGTGLTSQRTPSGSIVILATQPETEQVVVPELLVVGRRTNNADIRRTVNDIQPYQVTTSDNLLSAHADNLDQFLRARLPSNSVLQGPSQNPASQLASNRSEVDLHGLGANQTLVLVDGARLPSIPSPSFNLSTVQPDLNGLPAIAIDRIETLTATAGGIFGPGATGGVLNVVLKRDYRGADISAGFGTSDRGDARRRRVEMRWGFTPDGGTTDVQLTVSRSVIDALPVGERDYAVTARELLAAQDPMALLGEYPSVEGVTIRSLFGDPLTLKPALGGTDLGSSFTFIPADQAGAWTGGGVLMANAGRVGTALSTGGNGMDRSMTNDAEVTSVLLNVRRKFGGHVEALVDFVGLQNNGRATVGPSPTGLSSIGAVQFVGSNSPDNPFSQSVTTWFPLPGFDGEQNNRLRSLRLTTGLIVRLPRAWTAQASYAVGGVRNVVDQASFRLDPAFSAAIGAGKSPADGRPAPNPFGDWNTFIETLQLYRVRDDLHFERKSHFWDLNLRLAGPVASTQAGPISLTLLAERRRESVPASSYTVIRTSATTSRFPNFSQTVSSLYGELRAPLVRRDQGPVALRGLELQLAVRRDENETVAPRVLNAAILARSAVAVHDATAYTAGLRVFPAPLLMVRASVATGMLPPTPQQLLEGKFSFSNRYLGADPKRGGRILGSEGGFDLLYGGSFNLAPERARTLSAGLVFNPDGVRLPRVSVDYTHTAKHDEISLVYSGNVAYFLANETLYPDRVVRDPLTDADRASGFSAGRVTQIDASALNVGRTWLDAVDIRVDYKLQLGERDLIQPYLSATWQPTLKRQAAPDREVESYIGIDSGPLEWRGNAGLDWTRGALTTGFNLQYYSGYSDDGVGGLRKGAVGVRIPAQTYLDLYSAYVIQPRGAAGSPRAVEFRLGIQNVLDARPRVAIDADLGFSYYGDARRRRAEAAVTLRF
jgi:hypothetical protein